MILASQLGVIQGGVRLLLPSPPPSNYVNPEAIEKHNTKARAALGDVALRTAACVQPIGFLALTGDRHSVVQRPDGVPALWALSLLAVLQPTERVWCFRPKMLARSIALTAIRMGAKPIRCSLLDGERFFDPFDALFGGGHENWNRVECLKSIGINAEADGSLEEQARVLSQLVSLIG